MKIAHPGASVLTISILLATATSSCIRKSQTGAFVARVNNEYLTPQKVKESVDTSTTIGGPQVRDLVTQWVNSALLYEEAKSRGFDRSSEVNQTVEDIKRRLVIDRLIEAEVYSDQSLQPTEREVNEYYNQHKPEYLLTEGVARIQYVVFSNRDAAAAFRSQVVKGNPWRDVLQNFTQDSSLTATLIERADSFYVRQSAPSSKDLWKIATPLRVGETSPNVKGDLGYYIVSSLGMQSKGDIAELPLVAVEIQDRVLMEKRQKALEQLLERLRKKHTVQINLLALESTDTSESRK